MSTRLSICGTLVSDRPRFAAATAFGLPLDDFRARFALLSLHLWMILVRLRSEGKPGQDLGQARAKDCGGEQRRRRPLRLLEAPTVCFSGVR